MFNALTRRVNAEGDYGMDEDNTKPAADATAGTLFEDWFDPIELAVRTKVRGFIEAMIEEELSTVLCRPRYGRLVGSPSEDGKASPVAGHRHGHRKRVLTGTFGPTEIAVPRARLAGEDGKTTEWKSQALRAYQRRTQAAEALIASAYLSGTNTRRVRRALAAVFAKGVSKDIVSRTWRKVKGDWNGWSARSLAEEPIVRLILDGTVVRVRLDKKVTLDFPPCRARRQDGRSKSFVGGEEHGRRERGSLAGAPRRSRQTRPEDAGVGDRGRRLRPRRGPGGALVRPPGPALHGAQAS